MATTGGGLEEIIVTARRREEAMQDTPISVSALSSASLERSNVQALDDITRLMPNVAIQAQSGFLAGNTAFIRGIGSQEPLLSVDSPVGIYIDGVYIGRNNASNLELVDLERIEVLRGPQGTLFGRNTTGGAISMVTKKPASEFGVEQKVTVAQYDEYAARTRIDTGLLGETGLSATLSYMHRQRDGWLNNKYAKGSHTQGALNTDAVWAKVHGEWAPSRRTTPSTGPTCAACPAVSRRASCRRCCGPIMATPPAIRCSTRCSRIITRISASARRRCSGSRSSAMR
ncbi:TonB-dependent receptor [Rhizorhabdus histidinilytica]